MNSRTQYVGRLCLKHPEAGGVRYKSGHKCIECNREGARQTMRVKYGIFGEEAALRDQLLELRARRAA